MAKYRIAKEHFAEPRLQGDDRSVVDIAPGQMASAGDVVELIAKVAVSQVLGPQCESKLKHQLDGREDRGQAQSLAQRRVGNANHGGGCHRS
jgi:hypothetical protein